MPAEQWAWVAKMKGSAMPETVCRVVARHTVRLDTSTRDPDPGGAAARGPRKGTGKTYKNSRPAECIFLCGIQIRFPPGGRRVWPRPLAAIPLPVAVVKPRHHDARSR